MGTSSGWLSSCMIWARIQCPDLVINLFFEIFNHCLNGTQSLDFTFTPGFYFEGLAFVSRHVYRRLRFPDVFPATQCDRSVTSIGVCQGRTQFPRWSDKG